jgi:hypothetical protein
MDTPTTAEASEGFGTTFGGGDFREHFWRGSSGTSSSSEADESNKSNARGEARPAPPSPAEADDVFTALIITFADEAFSVTLSPEDYNLKLLLCFRDLVSNFSCSKV